MDAVVIKLALGLGMQSVIGWFAPILYGAVNVLPMLLTLFLYADKSSEYNALMLGRKSTSGAPPPPPTYDFIIVGGGSSGSVLARRLSKNFRVLVLERGGTANPLTAVPGLRNTLLGNPQVDYAYRTTPQNSSCLSCNNREIIWNAGMGLGGNSIINGMVYIRPNPQDFNRYATHTQDERWKYENVLPYFLRSERFCQNCRGNPQGITASINPKYHSSEGQLPVSTVPFAPLVPDFVQALEWGRVPKGDMNAPYLKPIGDVTTYVHEDGRRVNAFQAFVEPVEDRETLTIMKYARVIQILFEPGSNQATGVKFERFGKIEMAKASREVIVSAGAIESPKLLLLSGIGPKRHLSEMNIPVRVNLPNVGRNLQNHVGAIVGPFLIDRPLSILADRDVNDAAVDRFFKNGTGPLTVSGPIAHSLWSSTEAQNSGEGEWPDMHVFFGADGVGQGIDQGLSRRFNIRADILKEFYDPIKGQDAFTLSVFAGRPKSRGVIRLRSSDYMDDPVIDPRAYEDADRHDIQVVVEGMQRIVYLVENAPSFQRLGAKLSPIPLPSCRDYVFRSEEYWECFARHFTIHTHHFSGTNAMGPRKAQESVVDSELRVIGTRGLRVVDASVMPYVTTTNSYATTLMIAERGADLIIKAYSKNLIKRST